MNKNNNTSGTKIIILYINEHVCRLAHIVLFYNFTLQHRSHIHFFSFKQEQGKA